MGEVVSLGNFAVYEVDLYLEEDTPFIEITLDGHTMSFAPETFTEVVEAVDYLLDKHRNGLN